MPYTNKNTTLPQCVQTIVIWRCFSKELPEVNSKILVDLDGDIFESFTKMEYNLDNKLILMADMRQENGNSWFVGMIWFENCKWCYNAI